MAGDDILDHAVPILVGLFALVWWFGSWLEKRATSLEAQEHKWTRRAEHARYWQAKCEDIHARLDDADKCGGCSQARRPGAKFCPRCGKSVAPPCSG